MQFEGSIRKYLHIVIRFDCDFSNVVMHKLGAGDNHPSLIRYPFMLVKCISIRPTATGAITPLLGRMRIPVVTSALSITAVSVTAAIIGVIARWFRRPTVITIEKAPSHMSRSPGITGNPNPSKTGMKEPVTVMMRDPTPWLISCPSPTIGCIAPCAKGIGAPPYRNKRNPN